MNHVLRNTFIMSIPWQDLFRPDPGSSNRALKKYLQTEGLEFNHRDLVLLRQFSEVKTYFSYAALESWAEGELSKEDLAELYSKISVASDRSQILSKLSLSYLKSTNGDILVGADGELEAISIEDDNLALVSQESKPASPGSPLVAVYGGGLESQPSVGGVWNEEELQQESLTLLDGESAKSLI